MFSLSSTQALTYQRPGATESLGSICGERRACSVNYRKMLAIYIHLPQTLICQPAITSVAAGVAVCCRICSTTVNRLISPADIVSYLMQNSRLLDDNSGPVVGSQFCSVAKICRSNRIRKSGLPLTVLHIVARVGPPLRFHSRE